MGNCCSDVDGGMAAVGGTAASAASATNNQDEAVDHFLKKTGFHGGYSQIEVLHKFL
ncbi:hypothetical protein SLEP1_g56925 [Rubroshorea leprosula]|uniref:Uncharacterized protein n=1 Tax=Rubroshorea leprosula TaxID=152421 RepID=A0AAV5MJQ2_9ROSI|nr:hypothetical protein SLEP1_g56925 [Rubroshorea leprosula]